MKFPDHPVDGDVITDSSSGRTWQFDGIKWYLKGVELADVKFESEAPVHVREELDPIDGSKASVTYSFNMNDLPKINPN